MDLALVDTNESDPHQLGRRHRLRRALLEVMRAARRIG